MTGIGFIGGGAILKQTDGDDGHVRGIATAASIWNVGAIGAAVAVRRLEIAAVLSLANYGILRWLRPAMEEAEEKGEEMVDGIKEASDEATGGRSRPEDAG